MAAKKKTTTKKKAAPKRRKATHPKAKKATAPKPGTTITKKFKNKTIRVKVTAEGYEYAGNVYSSLTALALEITGYKAVSGPRFFGLVGGAEKGGSR